MTVERVEIGNTISNNRESILLLLVGELKRLMPNQETAEMKQERYFCFLTIRRRNN
jgi:hypothetical protein